MTKHTKKYGLQELINLTGKTWKNSDQTRICPEKKFLIWPESNTALIGVMKQELIAFL